MLHHNNHVCSLNISIIQWLIISSECCDCKLPYWLDISLKSKSAFVWLKFPDHDLHTVFFFLTWHLNLSMLEILLRCLHFLFPIKSWTFYERKKNLVFLDLSCLFLYFLFFIITVVKNRKKYHAMRSSSESFVWTRWQDCHFYWIIFQR